MHTLDWIILILPLLIVLGAGLYTHSYMKSVADFMSGGRVAGRYLLAVAKGEISAGAVVFVAGFEVISHAGFTLAWWEQFAAPIVLVTAIFGFVIYRYRETRAMTLAQFFEIRYNKSFRLFTGCLGFLAGVMNFGIIPAVGSRFMVYFLELPPSFSIHGFSVPTYIPLMGIFLAITVTLTLSGGLLTVMVTDCIEGIMSQIFYVIILVGVLTIFSWSEINSVLLDRPPGHSFLNPMDAGKAEDFNIWFVLMGIFTVLYGTMAWQNASSYNSAAISAHESRMSGLLGRWRQYGKMAVVSLLAICAMTFLGHPDFAAQSAHAKELIGNISESQIQTQMRIPIAVSEMLPLGLKGLLCASLIMGVFGGDSTHLHSWGSILVQDVFVPLRKKPFGPKQHIRALRISIMGVAAFAFLFGSLFQQTEFVVMWFMVTTGIFVGGAGASIIGGLYWKRGTTAGAWASMITGSILSFAGILARQIYGDLFSLNGQQIFFSACLIATVVYVVVSLLTRQEDFNMDRMLHRGEYAKLKPLVGERDVPVKAPRKVTWGKIIGFDENFTLGDKWIAGGLFGWSMFWFVIMVVGTIWNLFFPWPITVWSGFWYVFGLGFPIFFCVMTSIWFTWGGARDLRTLFRRLREQKVNNLDDGTVVNHQNLDEATAKIHDLPAPDAQKDSRSRRV